MAKINNPSTDQPAPDLNLSDETKSFQERIDEIRSLVEENLRYTKTIRQDNEKSELSSQLQVLLEKNLKLSNEILGLTKKINTWLLWQRVWGTLKFLLIIIPLLWSLIYLPPILKSVLGQYQDLANVKGTVTGPEILQQLFGNAINPADNAATK